MENINNLEIVKEVSEFCKEYNLDFTKVELHSDGLCTYRDRMDFSSHKFEEPPKALRYFKTIYFLSFNGCYKLKNLNNCENLINIVDCLELDMCRSLESVSALKNLKSVISLCFQWCDNLKSFDGLENVYTNMDNFDPEHRREEFLSFQKYSKNSKILEDSKNPEDFYVKKVKSKIQDLRNQKEQYMSKLKDEYLTYIRVIEAGKYFERIQKEIETMEDLLYNS